MDCRDLLQAGYRYAYSLTHSRHDAEDLVQEAWVKLSTSRKYTLSKSLLFTTVRHLFIDNYRRARLTLVESLQDLEESLPNDSHFDDVLANKVLAQALSTLRMEEREVLYLNVVEEFSALEIGKLTGQNRNTVLSLLHRGKRKLLQFFQTHATAKVQRTSAE